MATPDKRPMLAAFQTLDEKDVAAQNAAKALSDQDAAIVAAQTNRDSLATTLQQAQTDLTDAQDSADQAYNDYRAAVQAEAAATIPPSPLPKGATGPANPLSDAPPADVKLARK